MASNVSVHYPNIFHYPELLYLQENTLFLTLLQQVVIWRNGAHSEFIFSITVGLYQATKVAEAKSP